MNLPSKTFCALPWMHLSTRPDGAMRVCCTANASNVGPTNTKDLGAKVGELRTEDGNPANLNVAGLNESWNNSSWIWLASNCINIQKLIARIYILSSW